MGLFEFGRPDTAAAPAAPVASFEDLYRAHRVLVIRIVVSRVRRGDRHVVDDLVQETFLHAWRSFATARFTTAEEGRGWVATIARRAVCSYYREGAGRDSSWVEVVDPTTEAWASTWTTTAATDEAERVCLRVDLAASMAAASTAQRRAVQLRVVAGATWAVVAAQVLGRPGGGGRAIARGMVLDAVGERGADLGFGAVTR